MKPQPSPFYRVLALTIAAIALVTVVAAWPSGSPAREQRPHVLKRVARAPAPRRPAVAKRPNIVFVLTDDLSWNLVRFMPEVQRMQRRGATFTNYFVTSSLCCSSRASIFTGQYPHNNGVLRNTPPQGGYQTFKRRVGDRTFAPRLKRAGYRTAFLGKYLNGYRARPDGPARSWDLWFANGLGYQGFNYAMRYRDRTKHGPAGSPRGRVLTFGGRPRDYLVDVLRRRGDRFIRSNARRPFFMELSTFTPHLPTVPAPRDRNRFKHLQLPEGGSFDRPVTNGPAWLARHRRLGPRYIAKMRREWRRRARSVLAIDALLRRLRKTLEAKGIADRTYIVFSSDNGYHLGEHRLLVGKRTAFDHDIKVPLMVVGPGVKPGTRIDQFAANIDLAPTFDRIAGRRAPARTDGLSLLGLLHGQRPSWWRDQLLLEYHKPVPGPFADPDATDLFVRRPPSYYGLRSENGLYVEDHTGEREFYDLATDPLELHNRYRSLEKVQRARLHWELRRLVRCAGWRCRMPPPP